MKQALKCAALCFAGLGLSLVFVLTPLLVIPAVGVYATFHLLKAGLTYAIH